MARKAPEELAHLEWIGYVQPVGLVVSIPAMLEAQCYVNKNIMAEHTRFLDCLPRDKADEPLPEIRDLPEFAQKVLGWEADDLKEVPQKSALRDDMASLEVVLPQYHETLRPTHAVPVFQPAEDQSPWMMLVQELPVGADMDDPDEADSARHWNAPPQAKFERLLRESGVPIGLLSNRRQVRLVYAPKGESSGHATFNVGEMMQVAGRPLFAALHMLLGAERMFSLGDNQRLPTILENSRKYQSTVSTELAEQVLAALYELMRGFQAANDVRQGELLKEVLARDPNHVYSGLLTVLMRLVFVLYAEDRDLLSSDSVYSNHYSVTGLFDRLREDAGRFPDTMNQRFGAWAQLLTLFRLVYEGGQHGEFNIPGRKGYLFDPDRYPFLEGRQAGAAPDGDTPAIPRISDGVVFNVLQNLLILDGERLSYRTLDVEQIGSVYETVMGFNLEVARGKSIAIKPVKSHGAPATINLEELLETKGKDRAKWLKEQSDQKIAGAALADLKAAESIDELLKALDKKIAKKVTPRTVPAGAIVLQPSDERRRSGSHYTPRSLTEPIVRTTLEPILKQLCDPEAALPEPYQPSRGDKQRYTKAELAARVRQSEKAIEYARLAREVGAPHPAQILDLKICDPAMGSGAFLVETCRQLAEQLVQAWHAHALVPTDVPPDEEEELYARRLVAQRCLYGVDKNPMAVDLAKLALWLVTLAQEHPFTFLDHSLRYGDSLVGLSRQQIIGFHWEPKKQKSFGEERIQKRLDRATEARSKILNAREDVPYRDQEQRLAVADEALDVIRLTGDACVSAFFAGAKKRQREERCEELFASVSDWYASGHDPSKRGPIAEAAASLRNGEHPIPPFHWEIEFPEVFSRENGGFDAFVGNPPFLGGKRISTAYGNAYRDYLSASWPQTTSNVDLCGYFHFRTFNALKIGGAYGLISTERLLIGESQTNCVDWIKREGGDYYSVTESMTWPGEASVIIGVFHLLKRGKPAESEEAAASEHQPVPLKANDALSFVGCAIQGMGFVLTDGEYETLRTTPENEVIRPFLNARDFNGEINSVPTRHIIFYRDMSLEEAEIYPRTMAIVRERVKPYRDTVKRKAHRVNWWRYGDWRPGLYATIAPFKRTLVVGLTSKHLAFAFVPTSYVFDQTTVVIASDRDSDFAVVNSQVHLHWALSLGANLGGTPRYNPSRCFDTFPCPTATEALAESGRAFDKLRAQIARQHEEGLTKTYNRFHDPHERSPEIENLRELHGAMDRAVLEAYGWHDLAETARCEFLLDYEEEEDDSGRKSKRKKPWRLRWPDDFRDEVLARMLELNEQRHQEELLQGKAASDSKQVAKPNRKRKKQSISQTGELF